VKVENGDNQFWERKFHATNGKAQPALKVPVFFFSFGPGRGAGVEDLFHFSFVPNRFPMCSRSVFPIAPCFNLVCFGQSPPLPVYICGPKVRLSIFHRIFYFGEP